MVKSNVQQNDHFLEPLKCLVWTVHCSAHRLNVAWMNIPDVCLHSDGDSKFAIKYNADLDISQCPNGHQRPHERWSNY